MEKGSVRRSLVLIVFLAVAAYLFAQCVTAKGPQQMSYSEFLTELDGGKLASVDVLYTSDTITVRFREKDAREPFETSIWRSEQVMGELRERLETSGVPYTIKPAPGPSFFARFFSTILIYGLIFGLFWFLLIRPIRQSSVPRSPTQRDGGGGFLSAPVRLFGKNQQMVETKFSDVAGVDEAKQELQEVVDFLKDPTPYLRVGAKLPRGVLLIGPPGCGKTLLARAVAGEAGVPFLTMSGSGFIEVFVGVGASRVRDLFERAKKLAPSIIFIDELDAVGQRRSLNLGGGDSEYNQTMNQILAEMDGFEKDAKVVVIAATNRPEALDEALLRPGRFDRHVIIDLPDLSGRVEILRIHTRGKPLAADVNLEAIARDLPLATGADIENVVNEAALLAARRKGDAITEEDFRNAIDRKELGLERRSRKVSERERDIVAYHEAGHALVAYLLEDAEKPEKISIVARGAAGGYTRFIPSEERFKFRREYEVELRVLLGGYAAEKVQFGDVTPGSTNDRFRATRLAFQMVAQWGMDDELGARTYGQDRQAFLHGYFERDFSDEAAARIDEEVRKIVSRAAEEAIALLSANRGKLTALVRALKVRETLAGEELEAVLRRLGLDGDSGDS